MPKYFAPLTLLILLGLVLSRVIWMKRNGIEAMNFGKIDKKDFLIPPFALVYFYLVFAAAFNLPTISRQPLFQSEITPWIGVLCCLAGLLLFFWSLVSFGASFRVGIDIEHSDKLVTTGAFAVSRNPIYVAFGFVLFGIFLIFLTRILLIYFLAAIWLFNRQVLREEQFMQMHYGKEYSDYCKRVRRYL